jgi:predicted small metal-binding protein
MRTVECNICGEPLTAATDEELLQRMRDHFAAEHPESEWDEEAASDTIAAEAYDASDS